MSAVETDQPARAPLLAPYRSAGGAFDELLTTERQVRPHWERLLQLIERIGSSELASRREITRRILREHGATYNVYSDAQGLDRPWSLDLLPFLLTAEEWHQIEAGLIQRARLLNLLLLDIYGPQRVLKEELLPPALLFANPGFIRPCRTIKPAGDVFLFLLGVELARAPNGQWWVVGDRAQAPSGAGYALENRMVLSRVCPDEFRDCQVERLAGFFQTLRDTLRSLAPANRGNPSVVLLTPGPYNETYFEQVFLARYLGFPLVEGGDLTVRDRRVFIKTLEGLQPVDVILRRLDDTFCDPLELRAESSIGVPGLVEAARAGNVTLANALGSGVVEMPALMAFLPALSRHFLGEDLKLPNIATWWCGQEKELAYVRENLARLVVNHAFAQDAGEPVFGGRLVEPGRGALLNSMEAAPIDFVGQEQVSLSVAPVWESGHLEARPLILRAYICAGPDGYTVMPGGLTRFSASPDRLAVGMQSGGGSKDTWVLAEGPISPVTLLTPPEQVVRLERTAAEVPSRVADNLFWLGRYAERLEDTLRILRCVLARLSGETGMEETPELTALIGLLVNLDLFPARFRERRTLAGVEREIYLLIYQAYRLGAVREVIARLRNLAFALRDRFSADTWNILNQIQIDVRQRRSQGRATEALALLNDLIAGLAAFSGMEMENMTRGHGWRFLDMGRRLERAMNVVTLFQGALALGSRSAAALEPMLDIADSVMTYWRRYLAQPQWPAVLDLLLADEGNPRSLAFQVAALADHSANLPRDDAANGYARLNHQMAEVRDLLLGADWPKLSEIFWKEKDQHLTDLLLRFGFVLRSFSDSITHLYFSHAQTNTS
jgi:uncharacterized circularly permuted ATP-grasp superfamily protein/uncharacterized alpha-E superfamily protein